ncbi:acyl-CoA carboxylase epsilon subunit [Sinomonas mesophila]|uniref:acyl-CoA carboxylase epsilon subunit n=1 Tax=Sinomonas mesophila TaxID=1531955 RepID=UPI0009846083|nr:acyl-CoA carboxylase epsilon subunit [Sinomonas mesophila]
MSAAGLAEGAHDGDGVAGAEDRPVLFSVTKGNPTPEELAALTAVIAAAGFAEPEEAPAAPTRRERIRQATLRPRHVTSQRRGRL